MYSNDNRQVAVFQWAGIEAANNEARVDEAADC